MTRSPHALARLFVLAAALGAATPVAAQRGDSLVIGARYRITLPESPAVPGGQNVDGRWLTGELTERRADTLVIRPHPATGVVAVPVSATGRLERSLGVSRGASAVQYAVTGAVFGALLGSAGYNWSLRGPGFNTRWQAVSSTAALTAVGAFVSGFIVPRERWRRVEVPKGP